MQYVFTPELGEVVDKLCEYLAAITGLEVKHFRKNDGLGEYVYRLYLEGYKRGRYERGLITELKTED